VSAQSERLRRQHDAVLGGSRPPAGPPRPVVSASWSRSLQASVDPDRSGPPVVYGPDEIHDVRSAHPLAAVLPILRGALAPSVDAATQLMIVTDVDGHILWREGHPAVCAAADRVLLAEGTRWSENAIGTNAMGTALATRAPVQIFSAEHLVRAYHAWSCAAVPLRDPDTGRLIGTLDVSGREEGFHPALTGLVAAAAGLAEAHLRLRMMAADERLRDRYRDDLRALGGRPGALVTVSGRVIAAHRVGAPLPERLTGLRPGPLRLPDGRAGVLEPLARGWLLRLAAPAPARPAPSARPAGSAPAVPVAPPALSLQFLGQERPVVRVGGRARPLSLRHGELLTVLALAPEGRTAEGLALALYGEEGKAATVRVEMHRLRRHLGDAVSGSRPYRLRAGVDADFARVRRLLADGDVRGAAAGYRGALLPSSDAPEVRAVREELAATLRRSALELRDSEVLWTLAGTDLGRDDAEIHEALVELLPRTAPRAAAARARLRAIAEPAPPVPTAARRAESAAIPRPARRRPG
jgi:hypothetical protein